MRKEWLLVVVLVFSAFLIRVFRLNTPDNFMFDEVYHAFTAQAYAKNDPRGYEWWNTPPQGFAYEWLHPPLAKLIQAGSIKFLGDQAFFWRLPGTIFAAATVWLLYLFGKSLFKSPVAGLVAAFLYVFDGLSFVQSRITMNDIYIAFFITLAFYLFWRYLNLPEKNKPRGLFWVGVALGLAVSTKWTGFYAIPFLGGFWVLDILRKRDLRLRTFLIGAWSFAIIPIVMYFLSYSQFWLQGHTWVQFKELHNQIWLYQTNLKATHPYQSGALTWPILYRPVWYYVNYGQNAIANIYAMGNPAIWWPGIVAIGYLAIDLFRRCAEVARQKFSRDQTARALAKGFLENLVGSPHSLVLVGYFGFFLPWALSPRIMFLYHYLPSIPFMCLALGYGVDKLWQKNRLFVYLYLFVVFVVFLYFYPHLSGLAMPKWWVDHYFWFPSWR